MKRATFYHPTVGMELTMRITEEEARGLHALTVYGTETFIKTFREKMGGSIKPYENGLRELFESIKSEVPGLLKKADQAREAFKE